MNLFQLVGILLPFAHAAQLGYSTDGSGDIASLSFTWQNPDRSNDELTGPADGTLVTDDNVQTGEQLDNPAGSTLWGKDGATTQGMTGQFIAESLTVPADKLWWQITAASVTFTTTQTACIGSESTASAYYTDARTGAKSILGDATATIADKEITFTANIPSDGVSTTGGIGFDVATNLYCAEAEINIVEFTLEGEAVTTTAAPTQPPSPNPTMAPTRKCNGQITWGDPHYWPMAVDGKSVRFDYQGYGWHYYFFPCDWKRDYEDWPFFFLTEHGQWGNSKATIPIDNMLILNTRPDPWVIEFQYKAVKPGVETFKITVGTDNAGQKASDFDLTKKYTKDDPLVITYNDGQSQSGELRVYYKKTMMYLDLYDVQFKSYPRTCQKGAAFGAECGDYTCPDEVISIANKGYSTFVTCPTCFRNIACGLMGRYTRGDCTKADLKNPNHECYNIFLGSNGQLYTPPTSNARFVPFASTWHKDIVDDLLEKEFGVQVSYAKSHHSEGRNAPDGRAVDVVDTGFMGDCATDQAMVAATNETCRENTVVKYEACCKEIGICDELWAACTYDLCACKDSTAGGMTEKECLDVIVFDSMNATCGYDAFYPTDAPTTAPTNVPTRYVEPKEIIPQAQKLIWLYMVFVLVFVVIAVAAYCYYRKKNTAKVIVPDDEEACEMQSDENVQTYTQA